MERTLDHAVSWIMTSGLRVVLIPGALAAGLWMLRTPTRRLRAVLEGAAPSPEQAKRAATLTHIVRDALVVVATFSAPWSGVAPA
jgi:hypothetical protein